MDKRAFLRSYTLQQTIISRLKEMQTIYPEKKQTYQAQIKECIKKRKIIEKAINSVENEVYKEILIQKYFCKKTNEEIGLILNYSTRHIDRLHRAAIENLKIQP